MRITPQRVLAVGAHPDDIELGCFGTLLLLGVPTVAYIFSTLREDGFGETRAKETRAALGSVVKAIEQRDFPHAEIVPSQETVADLSKVVDSWNPDLVFTLTRWDSHQDHRAVEEITMSACRRRPATVVGYQSISSTPDFPVNISVGIDQVLTDKIAALQRFESQSYQPYMDTGFLNHWHHDKAARLVGQLWAECFHLYRAFLS